MVTDWTPFLWIRLSNLAITICAQISVVFRKQLHIEQNVFDWVWFPKLLSEFDYAHDYRTQWSPIHGLSSIDLLYSFNCLDSDHSEHPKDPDLGVHLPQASNSLSPKQELYNGEEAVERDCNQTPSIPLVKTTKSISTSTEDIVCTINKEDKSTSTDDLEAFEEKTESVESSDTENNDRGVEPEFHATSINDESDNICAGPEYQDTNLTDASKVQFLQSQLLAIQTQSVQERRKFSETRRYWTDPMIANNLGLNELQRASSSPSLLGEWLPALSPKG